MSRNLFRSWLVLILCAFALTAHGEREPQLSAVSRASAYILAAPHGGYDLGTARIVREVCQAVTWSCLIAERFRTKSRPLNVNRPTEGVGRSPENEESTPRAADVYARYRTEWLALGGDSAELYVEIHGNRRPRSAGRLEVAVTGLTREQAAAVDCVMRDALDDVGLSELAVHVEGRRPIFYRARANKRVGILSEAPAALHLEFPWAARKRAGRAATIAFLQRLLPRLPVIFDAEVNYATLCARRKED